MNLVIALIFIILASYIYWLRREIRFLESDNDKWKSETKKLIVSFNDIETAYEHEQLLTQELKALVVEHLDIFKDVIHANQVHTGKRGSSVLRPETLNKLRWGVDQATENGWLEAWRKPLDVKSEATDTPTEAQ